MRRATGHTVTSGRRQVQSLHKDWRETKQRAELPGTGVRAERTEGTAYACALGQG